MKALRPPAGRHLRPSAAIAGRTRPVAYPAHARAAYNAAAMGQSR